MVGPEATRGTPRQAPTPGGRARRGRARSLARSLAVAAGAGLVAVPLAAAGLAGVAGLSGLAGVAGASSPRAVAHATTAAPSFTTSSAVTLTTGGYRLVPIQAGGSPTPTVTMTGGTVPPGMTFSNGNATGSATIAGTPSPTQSTYTVDLQAASTAGTATQQLTISFSNQSAAPTFTSPASVPLTAGQYQTVDLAATGSPTPTITAAGVWPPGMAFSASPGTGTATLSGVPAPTASSYTVTLTASNGIAPAATQRLVLTFSAPPAFTSPALFHLLPNQWNKVTVTTSGAPAPTLHLYGNLPPGMSFTAGSGGTAVIQGVAHPGSTTAYDVSLVADNGVGQPATQHLELSFTSGVTFTSPSTMALRPGQYNDLTITTTATPVAQLHLQGDLPPGLSFRANDNGTATILGVLSPTSQTSWPVTVTAGNGQGLAAVQHLDLVVPAPVAFTSPATVTLRPASYEVVNVTTRGTPTPKVTLAGTLPPGMVFRPDDANGSATITGYVQPGVTGSYPVTLTATNGLAAPVQQTLTLTFSQAPAITTTDQLLATDGSYVKLTIHATGTPTPTVRMSGTLPAGLAFYGGTGIAVIAGTPHYGVSGSSTVQVVASNGAGPDAVQVLHLTVAPASPPTNPAGNGYWYATSTGSVIGKGQARLLAPQHPQRPRAIVGIATTPDQQGYWLVSSYGGVFAYGNAPFLGSTAHLHLPTPTIALAATRSGDGYYEVTRSGNVYTYGDATFYGSTAGRGLPPIAAFALTPDGHGYWMVSVHGNVYAFGDARFFGSPARLRIPPVVAFAPTPSGNGYWVVTANGGVLVYGDATSYGSLAGRRIPPVVAFAPTKDGRGYWLVTRQGNVFNLGDARFLGSSAHTRLPGAVVSMTPMF